MTIKRSELTAMTIRTNNEEIMAAIQAKVGSYYGYWTIGMTNDPAERRRFWTEDREQSSTYWQQWISSLEVARSIAGHFVQKGMKLDMGGHASANRPVYVYVF